MVQRTIIQSRRAVAIVFVGVGLLAISGFQRMMQKSLTRNADDLTLSAASAKARQAAESLDRPVRPLAKMIGQIRMLGVNGKQYRVWDVSDPGKYNVNLDSRSGFIYTYFDHEKMAQHSRGEERTGAKFFSNISTAKQRVRYCATKLGTPAEHVMTELNIKGEPGDRSGQRGVVSAGFKDASGDIKTTIVLDIQDGRVIEYVKRP